MWEGASDAQKEEVLAERNRESAERALVPIAHGKKGFERDANEHQASVSLQCFNVLILTR